MQKIYCEICGAEGFNTNEECNTHEENCKGELVVFVCEVCGEIITYYKSSKFDLKNEVIKAQCHVLDAGTMNYGSELEGHVKLNCCDKCLVDMKSGKRTWCRQ